MGGGEDRNDGDRMLLTSSSTSLIQRRPSSGSLSMLEGLYRKSFSSYKKLPQVPLKLSVLKLDGSCFDIEVMRTATILELKDAVESVFGDMPISWKHLWGQFCLSLSWRPNISLTMASRTAMRLMPKKSNHEMRIEEEREGASDIESGSINHRKSGDNLHAMTPLSSQGVLSYSELSMVEYEDEVATLYRRSKGFWSRFRKIMVFCRTPPQNSKKDSWRDD